MCNLMTGEHVFIWISGDSTGIPPKHLICKCGQFRFDGKPTREITATHQPAQIIMVNEGKDFIFVPPLSWA